MSCSQLVLPKGETPVEVMLRKRYHDLLSSLSESSWEDFSDWVPSKPAVVAHNVLLDDAFISDLRPNLSKQLTEEQIENLRGKTASRILVGLKDSEYSITLEF